MVPPTHPSLSAQGKDKITKSTRANESSRDEGGGSQTTVCGPPHSLPNNPYYYVTVDTQRLLSRLMGGIVLLGEKTKTWKASARLRYRLPVRR